MSKRQIRKLEKLKQQEKLEQELNQNQDEDQNNTTDEVIIIKLYSKLIQDEYEDKQQSVLSQWQGLVDSSDDDDKPEEPTDTTTENTKNKEKSITIYFSHH